MIAADTQGKQMQKLELEMFRVFVEICDILHLRYYVLGGTLLGAVRHEGFIPWDDDIDVGMPRADFEVFLKEAGKMLPEGLCLQSYHTEPEYHSNAAKIRNSNTTYVESAVCNSNINHGIFLDIFPLDYYPEKKLAQYWFDFRRKLYSLRISTILVPLEKEHWSKRLVKGFLKILYPTMLGASEKRDRLYKTVPCSSLLANHSGMWGKKEIIPEAWYAEGKMVTFEGMQVRAPKEYEKWLRQVYGDYMQLPPIEKRVTHHYVEVIDLEKPYTAYEGIHWKVNR